MTQSNNSKNLTVCLILGDQLDANSLIFADLKKTKNRILMAEVLQESKLEKKLGAPSSQQRTTLFLTAMRHFKVALIEQNYQVTYYDITKNLANFSSALDILKQQTDFKTLRCVLPGDERVRLELKTWCVDHDVNFEVLEDQHFIAEKGEFKQWIKGKKQPRMEYWYRHLRKTRNILMDDAGQPMGGQWNFDKDNRKSFTKQGPQDLAEPPQFDHDKDPIFQQVKTDIKEVLPNLAGNLKAFPWPVNREQALLQLEHFIKNNLAHFGDYQDAMWQERPFLFHSLLSSSINLKLLHPMEVIKAAEQAYYDDQAPMNAVEGFIRQILGWREYVRGLYWLQKSQWSEMNHLAADANLPEFYWDANTEMNCLSQSVQQVVDYGYGHHIQRLMVTGLFSLLYGIEPRQIEQWYLAMYVDAIAWVEQPNTLGMSQYADGGFLASKPYIASGQYINRMSNYCKHCKFKPQQASGDEACPFTTLYWDFVQRHRELLEQNPRLGMQVKNWLNKSDEERDEIIQKAKKLRQELP